MPMPPHAPDEKPKSLRSLEWLNFFLADVQTGLGPFLAAYLAASGWNPQRVGYALTFGGLVGVAMQTPAGAAIDAVRHKRRLLAASLVVLAGAACLFARPATPPNIYLAQLLLACCGPFLAPTVAAITLGITGPRGFDRQFGRNQAFNSAGNVLTALSVAWISYTLGYRAIFLFSALLVIPAGVALFAIDDREIDYAQSRGSCDGAEQRGPEGFTQLLGDRVLLAFLAAAFLFHLANAAMLPELAEMLSRNNPRAAAPFMAACVTVTQLVIALTAAWIGKRAAAKGRKPLLLIGFGILPVRGVLYTLTHAVGFLVGIQVLDGVANAIFGIVSILIVRDRTEGTGRFNVAAGALATMVGIGAGTSNALGGTLAQHFGYRASFLGLAAVALVALAVVALAVPETLAARDTSQPAGGARPAEALAPAD
jgi:MFS family permease